MRGMGVLDVITRIYELIPEVRRPTQKHLSFKEKLKWTGLILVAFFALGLVPLYGLGGNAFEQFEFLSIILGASFGSILSLGIGPIVTSSIVLQLLAGSGLLPLDLTTHEGREKFQGLQKVGTYFFILFEAAIYVFMGGLTPNPALAGSPAYLEMQFILAFQLVLGGIVVVFMDEVVDKWGFGSGVSLFILAGVSQSLVIRLFSPLHPVTNPSAYVGAVPELLRSLASGDSTTAGLEFMAIFFTLVVFAMCVFGQAMKIEIPLSFGRVRGYSIRWPLNFLYTSNIPVILVSALMANLQLWARLMQNWGYPLLGTFVGNTPASGLVALLNPPNIAGAVLRGSLTPRDLLSAAVYLVVFLFGCLVFSVFWVQTSGMDAKSQAKQIMASGLQIPGFRRDPRILERILSRYIGPLTVMGGISIGVLAATADLLGALERGTGILLAVMIVYKLYEDIARQHMMDMHPMMRRFMEG